MATVIQTYSYPCIPCCTSTQKCQFCGDSDLPPTFYATIAGCPTINSTEDYTPLNGTFLMTQGTVGAGTPDTNASVWTFRNFTYVWETVDSFYFCSSYGREITLSCNATGGYHFHSSYGKNSILSTSTPSVSCEEYYNEHGNQASFIYALSMYRVGYLNPHNTGSSTTGLLSPAYPAAEAFIFYSLNPTDSCDPLYIASSGDIQLVYQQSATGSGGSRYGLASDVSGVTVTLHP